MTKREAKLLVLAAIRSGGRVHKLAVVGRPFQRGAVETNIGRQMTDQERAFLSRVFDELRRDDFIRPDFGDLSEPENWVDLTTAGQRALSRGALDPLDEAILELEPRLVEMREGAWSQLESTTPDALRQAADSMREFVDQVLHVVAPDHDVGAAPWFVADPSSRSGITRAQRARLAMERRSLAYCQDSCNQLVSTVNRLSKFKHPADILARGEVRNAVESAELALKAILLEPANQ